MGVLFDDGNFEYVKIFCMFGIVVGNFGGDGVVSVLFGWCCWVIWFFFGFVFSGEVVVKEKEDDKYDYKGEKY